MINDRMAVKIGDPHDSTSVRIDFVVWLTEHHNTSIASRFIGCDFVSAILATREQKMTHKRSDTRAAAAEF